MCWEKYTWKFVPFDLHHPFSFPQLPFLWTKLFFKIPHVSDTIQCVSFSVWLISLIIMPSGSSILQMARIPPFSLVNNILVCVNVPHFLYSFIEGHVGCLHILAIVNNAVENFGVQISLWDTDFSYFGYISRSGINGLYDSSCSLELAQ